MEIEIISFGKISEFVSPQLIDIQHIETTDELRTYLEERFPELSGMKYKMALNKVLFQQNQQLKDKDSIALMPPFSGG